MLLDARQRIALLDCHRLGLSEQGREPRRRASITDGDRRERVGRARHHRLDEPLFRARAHRDIEEQQRDPEQRAPGRRRRDLEHPRAIRESRAVELLDKRGECGIELGTGARSGGTQAGSPELRQRARERARQSGLIRDRLESTELALCTETVQHAHAQRLDRQWVCRGQPEGRQIALGELRGETTERHPMPPEPGATLDNTGARDLVSTSGRGTQDQHLFVGCAGGKPGSGFAQPELRARTRHDPPHPSRSIPRRGFAHASRSMMNC